MGCQRNLQEGERLKQNDRQMIGEEEAEYSQHHRDRVNELCKGGL